jgi:hypothetical protein
MCRCGGRTRRPIVCDPLETSAAENQVVLGVACETPHLWLINDLVQSQKASGTPLMHPYLRLIAPADATAVPGVIVLATIPAPGGPSGERVVLVEQERHATSTVEQNCPAASASPASLPLPRDCANFVRRPVTSAPNPPAWEPR